MDRSNPPLPTHPCRAWAWPWQPQLPPPPPNPPPRSPSQNPPPTPTSPRRSPKPPDTSSPSKAGTISPGNPDRRTSPERTTGISRPKFAKNGEEPPTPERERGWTDWTTPSRGSANTFPIWATTESWVNSKRSKWLKLTFKSCEFCWECNRKTRTFRWTLLKLWSWNSSNNVHAAMEKKKTNVPGKIISFFSLPISLILFSATDVNLFWSQGL